MAARRLMFVPVWLILVIGITAGGLYFGYKAPHIVVALVIVTALVGGSFSFVSRGS